MIYSQEMQFFTDSEVSFKADIDFAKQVFTGHICVDDPKNKNSGVYCEVGQFKNPKDAFKDIIECIKKKLSYKQNLILLRNSSNEFIDVLSQSEILQSNGIKIEVKNS